MLASLFQNMQKTKAERLRVVEHCEKTEYIYGVLF